MYTRCQRSYSQNVELIQVTVLWNKKETKMAVMQNRFT